MPEQNFYVRKAMDECVIVTDIGQLTKPDKAALRRAVKAGTLERWRGYWYPVAGAGHGVGALRACYGTPAARAALGGV